MKKLALQIGSLVMVMAIVLSSTISISYASRESISVSGSAPLMHAKLYKAVSRLPIMPAEPEAIDDPEPLYGRDLYISYIEQIISEYYPSVDPYIVLAVMWIESRYEPNVGYDGGPVGLMQVMPKYHYWRIEKYGLTDIWDPYTNILCGVDLLNDLYSDRGDWSTALLGYNNSYIYVNNVLETAEAFRKDGYFG